MKKIIFCDQYGQMGGGQQVLLELVKAAQASMHVVTVLLPAGSCADKLKVLGVEVLRIPHCVLAQGKKSIADILRLTIYNVRVFLQNFTTLRSADLIYINGNRLLPVAFLAQKILGKRAACHIHLNHGSLEKKLLRCFCRQRHTVAVVVPSSFIQRELIHFDSAFDSPKVRVVENGLDARFTKTVFEDRFSGKPLRHIGIVGRISPEKGQDVLPALARYFPDMDFHVLGDAAFSAADFYTTLQRDSPPNVHFHGWVEDLPHKVHEIGLQLCLIPSRVKEAFSLTSIEMTALSCLVVARRMGALEDMAKSLQLACFDSDDELVSVIDLLSAQPVAAILAQCKNSHALTVLRYSHNGFHERLKNLLFTLMLER